MTRLSERMEGNRLATAAHFAHHVRALEAELASERERAQMLAADRDRARRNALNALDAARSWEERAYAMFLYWEMREHALRGRIANQRAELKRLHAQIATVESEGMTLRFRDAVSKWQARAQAAEREYCAIAEALGIMYEADGYASAPGPLRDVLQCIECLKAAHDRELDRSLAEHEAKSLPTATATLDGWKVGDACEVRMYCANLADTEWLPGRVIQFHSDDMYAVETQGRIVRADVRDMRRPIPPSEPAIEGGRGLDAARVGELLAEGREMRAAFEKRIAPMRVPTPEPRTECQEVTCEVGPTRVVRADADGTFSARKVVLAGNATDADWLRVMQEDLATTIVQRDEALARIAELERLLEVQCVATDEAHKALREACVREVAALKRAERAERTLQRVRERCARATGYLAIDVQTILDWEIER